MKVVGGGWLMRVADFVCSGESVIDEGWACDVVACCCEFISGSLFCFKFVVGFRPSKKTLILKCSPSGPMLGSTKFSGTFS